MEDKELLAQLEYLKSYCPKVHNMTSSRGNYVPNQFVIQAYDKQIFQSYNSIIAIKHEDGRVELGSDWDYSTTTGKYRNEFLGEDKATTQAKLTSGEYTLNKLL